jgi:hypothetical protein
MGGYECVQHSLVCPTLHMACPPLLSVVIYLVSYKKVGEDGEES